MGADKSQQPERVRERATRRDEGARSGRGSASALDALRKQEAAKARLHPRPEAGPRDQQA